MKTLRVRFAVMLATAAVVPLLTYGAVSVYSLRDGTRRIVEDGNLNVARQVGEQVRRYIASNLQILQALAAELEDTNLSARQTDQVLKNYVLRIAEFRELTVIDNTGRALATSRVGPPGVVRFPQFREVTTLGAASGQPSAPAAVAEWRTLNNVRMSRVFVDDDMLPTMLVAAPLGRGTRTAGWLVGEFSIEELWRMAGRIHVGARGYVLVVGPGGELLAHGNPDELWRVASDAEARKQGGGMRGSDPDINSMVDALRAVHPGDPINRETTGPSGERLLAVGVGVPELDWAVVVEQPAREAFVVARRHENELIAAISLALLIMVMVGSVWGRSLIAPIMELIRGTQAIAEGRFDERV